MNLFKKNILCAFAVSIILLTNSLKGVDSIAITAPAASSTVTGMPLAISGTSSQANKDVRVSINTTEIAIVTTAGDGTWSFSLDDLYNGSYTITATLISDSFEILATSSNNFTVSNPNTIFITYPEEGNYIVDNPALISGEASLASTSVSISVDSVPVATTTTDAQGNWQTPYTLSSNGAHTLMAQLMGLGSPVTTVTINAQVPVIFSTGMSEMSIIAGRIPTAGSGVGSGYSYSVAGSAATITFSPTLSSVPVVTATGLYSLGSSTVSLASVSTTTTVINFSAGTEEIHFVALTLA